MSKKVVIIDYKMGNTLSISNALEKLGYSAIISSDENDINNADALILPGVGAFREAIENIQKNNLQELLNENVQNKRNLSLEFALGCKSWQIQEKRWDIL